MNEKEADPERTRDNYFAKVAKSFKSKGKLPIESMNTLVDLRVAAARTRVERREQICCPACRDFVLHDSFCRSCGADLPNVAR